MLGIKFKQHEEERLERFARELRRPKSSLAREWILERLDREEIDGQIRTAAGIHALEDHSRNGTPAHGPDFAVLAWLDAEDGGYDWGPAGPPAPQ